MNIVSITKSSLQILPLSILFWTLMGVHSNAGHRQPLENQNQSASPSPAPSQLPQQNPPNPPRRASFAEIMTVNQNTCSPSDVALLRLYQNPVSELQKISNQSLGSDSEYDPSAEARCTEQTCTEAYCAKFYTDGEINWPLLEAALDKESKGYPEHEYMAAYTSLYQGFHYETRIVCDKNGTLRSVSTSSENTENPLDPFLSAHTLWGNPRFKGGGSVMVNILVKKAETKGLKSIKLSSRKNAVGFYARMGFHKISDPSQIKMVLPIPLPSSHPLSLPPDNDFFHKRTLEERLNDSERIESDVPEKPLYKLEKRDPGR